MRNMILKWSQQCVLPRLESTLGRQELKRYKDEYGKIKIKMHTLNTLKQADDLGVRESTATLKKLAEKTMIKMK